MSSSGGLPLHMRPGYDTATETDSDGFGVTAACDSDEWTDDGEGGRRASGGTHEDEDDDESLCSELEALGKEDVDFSWRDAYGLFASTEGFRIEMHGDAIVDSMDDMLADTRTYSTEAKRSVFAKLWEEQPSLRKYFSDACGR